MEDLDPYLDSFLDSYLDWHCLLKHSQECYCERPTPPCISARRV